jgi:hypothetical protein
MKNPMTYDEGIALLESWESQHVTKHDNVLRGVIDAIQREVANLHCTLDLEIARVRVLRAVTEPAYNAAVEDFREALDRSEEKTP